jgi:anti-anti-sigma factor
VSFAHKDQFDDDLTVIIIKIGDDLQPRTLVDKTARFAADLSQLEAVREFIQGVCSQAPGDHQLLSQQLCLAVNEAFCNSVQHAYEGGPGDIIVHAELGEEGIFIELSDQGKGFDPREAPEPSLAGDRDHNFGLFILRQVSDVMNYVAKAKEDGWNHLRLFKRYYWEKKHMEFTQALDGNVLVITLEGNSLDAREAPQFKDRITDLISNQRAGNVVFDLQHLKFIDSSGLGSLLSVLKHLNAQKGDLKLASVPPEILTMFEIVRMHKLFEIHPSRSDAVKSFG